MEQDVKLFWKIGVSYLRQVLQAASIHFQGWRQRHACYSLKFAILLFYRPLFTTSYFLCYVHLHLPIRDWVNLNLQLFSDVKYIWF